MPSYYHASTERFNELQPRYSSKFGRTGIFLAPNIRSILSSWGEYVLNKRKRQWQLARLKHLQKRAHLEYRNVESPKESQTLYLYQIDLPHNVERAATALHDARRDEILSSKGALGGYKAWSWDEELFIPSEYIPELSIIRCKELTSQEFLRWRRAQHWTTEKTLRPKTLDIYARLHVEEMRKRR